jgi:hypothetical protein
MYQIAVGHNSGYSDTFIESEKEAREFIKLNRDSHMEVYFNDKLILEIHDLLPFWLIDRLDLSGDSHLIFE